MMTTLLVGLGVLCGVLGLGCGVLWRGRERQRRVAEERRVALEHEKHLVGDLDRELRDAEVEQARLREQVAGFEQRLVEQKKALEEALAKSQEASERVFKALAGDVLKSSTDEFLKVAGQRLKTEQKEGLHQIEERRKAVEGLVTPIREALAKQSESVTKMEKEREAAYHALRQQLVSLGETQIKLKDETGNLVKALRRPEVRGRWGEIQLRRVAELAGMIDHCDFAEQPSFDKPEVGKQRPDMAVALAGGRRIVVDAKTPLDAYLDAMQESDEAAREVQLDRHAAQIMTQVNNLSSKGYQQNFERSPDFVVLFIPSEAFLEPALRRRPTLIEEAMGKGIVIATPGTLMALLKVVAMGWREERVAESAREIAEHGRELHKRVATAVAHLQRLGKAIDSTVDCYNKFAGSVDRQVLPQARRFEELGAGSEKEVGEVRMVEGVVRGVEG
ncbi:MAG: DNA recombination protein RmuC [Phycisphaeraceae bacterium]